MTDDDRNLADRLRRYESGVPVDGDPPALVRPRRVPWAVVAGAAAVLLLAVVLASGLLRNEPAVGDASASPSASAGESVAPSADVRRRRPITAVAIEDGGSTLVVEFSGNECMEDYAADATQAADVLEVTVYGTPRALPSGHACAAIASKLALDIALDPTFTGSEVRDGYTGQTFTVGVASASATPAPATPEPAPGQIVHWAQVGVFGSEGWAEEVRDMTYAAGHFIAIGYREPDDQRGRVGPPIDEARIWISADGRSWEQIAPGPVFQDGHPRTIVTLADGSAVAYGSIDPEPPASSRTAAWRTTDGRTWTSLELTLPRDEFLPQVVGGPNGLITVVSVVTETSQTEEIWHSVDGASWRIVHRIEPRDGFHPGVRDWEAGPEGFVLAGAWYRSGGGQRDNRAFVFASGDGETWFEAPPDETGFALSTHVAPIGGDWMIAASEVGESNYTGRATTWFSANGLAWDERTAIDVPMPTSPFPDSDTGTIVASLVGTGERLIASGGVVICCHGPWWAAGVWSSSDGRAWERLGFPDGTVVAAAAEHDGVVVLGGFDRARPEDDFKARAVFWIGERR